MPDRTHGDLQELLGAYALDAVDPVERDAVEDHLRECPRCRAEVAEHLETAALLAAGGASAPEGMWDRIAEALEEAPAAELDRTTRPRRRWVSAVAVAAAIAVIGALSVQVIEQDRRLDQLNAGMEDEALVRAANAALLDPQARQLVLVSEDREVSVDAVLLPDGSGYIVRDNLEALSAAETYQLWALNEADPISSGLLGPDPEVAVFTVGPNTTGLAITREVAGGVVASKNPPVAVGQIDTQ